MKYDDMADGYHFAGDCGLWFVVCGLWKVEEDYRYNNG